MIATGHSFRTEPGLQAGFAIRHSNALRVNDPRTKPSAAQSSASLRVDASL